MKPPPDRPAKNHVRTGDDSLTDRQCQLLQMAHNRSPHGAAIIEVKTIVVDDRLADLCRDPGCPNYGLAASCPPHGGGPDQFRRWQATYDWAVLIKIDVPTRTLLSKNRRAAFRRLHEIAVFIEQFAIDSGYSRARALAGGSCKELFCADMPACPVITGNGPCRQPDRARPSMSGYGIDVSRLMAAAGWEMNRATAPPASQSDHHAMAPITALVLID